MFYPRRIYHILKAHLSQKEVTVITGMRRTGKTALLTKLKDDIPSENKVLIDLESRINREIFQNPDYDDIWKNLIIHYGLTANEQLYILLDEIQYLRDLPSIIKYLFDHYRVKFIVTGSSSFYLKNLFTESLSGRKQVFELFPLTFDEFLVFKKKLLKLPVKELFDEAKKSDWRQKAYDVLFEEYLKYGGFPQTALMDKPEEKTDYLKDVLYSYIDTDVKNISSFRKISEVENLIRLLAGRIGQKLDVARIAREIPLSRKTINEYIAFLEASYLIFLVRPYSKSADREISKTPKLYFCDTGLANVLSQIASGQMLENSVFHALRVKHKPKLAFGNICYYQRKSGVEIDFIVDREIAIEVKETAEENDQRRLVRLSNDLGIVKFYLISQKHTNVHGALYASQM